MDDAKSQLVDKLKTANNVLVTVSRNPSVDQLAACIGLTLLLNKQGKHAAAVFSGQVPSTIEFLQPEETLEKNTDSLRDFIIALDKSKADKLRYKVEDNVVRIFITPYKTSISQEDLEFSQGDFNVDVVIALGVQQQEDLDEAITAHGRILHDATVTSVNTSAEGGLGSINWQDAQASSLCELVTDLAQALGGNMLDNQIATALLTGIVAETERFSNDKTSSQTMSASATLMAAGANQQLIATKLEEPPNESDNSSDDSDDGGTAIPSDNGDDSSPKPGGNTLEIDHGEGSPAAESSDMSSDETDSGSGAGLELPIPDAMSEEAAIPELPGNDNLSAGSKLVTEPPSLGGTLTANSQPEGLDPVTDPLSMPASETAQLLDRSTAATTQPLPPADAPSPEPAMPGLTPPPPAWVPPPSDPMSFMSDEANATQNHTLSELEAAVSTDKAEAAHLDAARDEVSRALNDSASAPAPQPVQSLNAQPMIENLHATDTSAPIGPTPSATPTPTVIDPSAPPPVPPPIPFQFGTPGEPPQP